MDQLYTEFEINSRLLGRRLHKKMLTLNVTNRIIMKITVWLIPTSVSVLVFNQSTSFIFLIFIIDFNLLRTMASYKGGAA
jgi:hypothetical protein